MQKLIITVAVNGGITSRQKNPNVPYSPDEIAESVYACWNSGASIAHIHAREADGSPSYNALVYKEIIDKIRSKCNILINLSTSGLNLPDELEKNEAWNHLAYNPDIASFNCGSVNHGDKPFINPPKLAQELANDLNKYGVKPEIEVYHTGVIGEAIALADRGYITDPMYFAFASQSLAVLRAFGLPDDASHVNANGGSIALGHPLGMTGTRIVGTAANQLVSSNLKYALCTMCVGVGQGSALILENISYEIK